MKPQPNVQFSPRKADANGNQLAFPSESVEARSVVMIWRSYSDYVHVSPFDPSVCFAYCTPGYDTEASAPSCGLRNTDRKCEQRSSCYLAIARNMTPSVGFLWQAHPMRILQTYNNLSLLAPLFSCAIPIDQSHDATLSHVARKYFAPIFRCRFDCLPFHNVVPFLPCGKPNKTNRAYSASLQGSFAALCVCASARAIHS